MGKRQILLLSLSSLWLAACVSPAQAPDADVPLAGQRPELLSFPTVVPMDQSSYAAEPNIAILPDGTIFITAASVLQDRPNAIAGAAWLWRSTDGGKTWQTLRSPVRAIPGAAPGLLHPFCSCDADVVTSPDGWVYYTDWWSAHIAAGNYLVERSGDGGATWSSTPVTQPNPGTLTVDRQWLLAGENGLVALFYSHFYQDSRAAGGGFMSEEVVLSEDHGTTWSLPVTVLARTGDVCYQAGHPTRIPRGALVLPYGEAHRECGGSDWLGAPSDVAIALSNDNGRSWRSRKVAEAPSGFGNLWAVEAASDDAGNLFVVWAARSGDGMQIYLARSLDEGESWDVPRIVRAEGLNFLPWIGARGTGDLTMAWYGGDATGDPAEAGKDATWYAYAARSNDSGETIVVSRITEEPVKTGPLCPRGSFCGFAGHRELADYLSLAYDANGNVHFAFARAGDTRDSVAARVLYVGPV